MFQEELGSLQTPMSDQGTTDISTQLYEDDKFSLSIRHTQKTVGLLVEEEDADNLPLNTDSTNYILVSSVAHNGILGLHEIPLHCSPPGISLCYYRREK